MPRYAYRAKDEDFNVVEGTMEAESDVAVISRLGREGMFPISIMEVGTQSGKPRPVRTGRVSTRALAYFTRQLADLLAGGLPLLNALSLLARQTESAALSRVADSLANSVRDGRSLSESLVDFPTVFPALYHSMVKAGETGGSLEQSLGRLADLGEHEAELRSRMISAAAYPLFVLFIAAIMVIFLILYVIPKLSLVFAETGQLLPWPTRFLLGISQFFTQWWWLALISVMAAILALRSWLKRPSARSITDRLMINLPGIGLLVRKLETSRFTRNLGTLVGQGIPILQALDVVVANVSNVSMRKAIGEITRSVREGSNLALALSSTGQFPVFVSNMVAVGEEAGTIDAALLKVAQTYEREVDRATQQLTTILEPLLLVLVGGVVMFIVLAMLLPVFQIGLVVQ
ncbi:MAG: type II secretion system F family protein [Candidatus Omnitrophica bacterium]|nr:type II secretion system F family protein [Candidatus Omnitrophota bacterium]MBI2173856.1 type II secretion system F family protein [Candidatus Omnitrophota bacterium]MBI3009409.1 type II secretion system F family protein [Candidatus Omnitrophota bacterium]